MIFNTTFRLTNKINNNDNYLSRYKKLYILVKLGCLLRPDIVVQFHFVCLGTEIFLRELTLSSTLSSNPKSSRSVDLQFLHKLLFYIHKFYDKFFIVQRHG